MKNLLLALITLVFANPMANGASAPDSAQSCVACHGQAGVSVNPQWPNLAGQKAGYLEVQLKAFRDGSRVNPAMAPFVKGLSDADIATLAAYYAELPAATTANGDPDLVASGENLSAYCKSCHGMKGIPAASVWPNLAGQQATYLEIQLAAYKKGARTHPHMETVVQPFGNAEFRALAAYYSQLKP